MGRAGGTSWGRAIAIGLGFAAALAVWFLARSPGEPAELHLGPRPLPEAGTVAQRRPAADLRRPVELEVSPLAASAAAPSDEESALEEVPLFEDADRPPDPVELGPARLDLRLLEAGSGAGLASYVELWRVDAPGSEEWTAGDQLQDQALVPVEGWLFTRLPEGRYRAVAHAQVWNEEAPEIEVRAPRTRLDLRLDVPRTFRLRLDVRDRFGAQVPSVTLALESTEYLEVQAPWRWERSLKREAGLSFDAVGAHDGGAGRSTTHGPPQPPDGFDLGSFREADRGGHSRKVLELLEPGGGRVRVRVPPRAGEDVKLLAVAVAPDAIEPLVRLPPGAAGPLEVDLLGEAVEHDPRLPEGGWQLAPVTIQVQAAGLLTFLHTWRPADGELPGIQLERGP